VSVPLTDTDIALLAGEIRRGNASAFAEFFQALWPDLFRFLYRLTRDRQAAEDLTQDAFARFWLARERIDPDLGPRYYLYRIARNLAADDLSRRSRTRRASDTGGEILIHLAYDPAEAYERSLAAHRLLKSLSILPERCRAVFVLTRYHDFSYEEVARTLDISLQTVKNQMNKALSLLRKVLAEEFE
jgi:RNA polymerase sigma-70 factor, ECF subfamily